MVIKIILRNLFLNNMNSKFLLLSIAVMCLACFGLRAQETAKTKAPLFKEKGFMVGVGHGIDSLNIPEGRYTPYFFIAHFGIDLLRNKKIRRNPGIFTLYFEPQVNPVIIKKPTGNVKDLEFGLNIGFKHMYPLIRDLLYSYILIASGPQYITVHTSKQTRGFIFSDNFGMGTYIFMNKTIALNLGFRLRHMSNGDTRFPNHGINTFNYQVGISKFIR
jgi:hypothetical protein